MKTFFIPILLILNSYLGISQENIDYRPIAEIFSRKSNVRYTDLPDEHFYEINKNIHLDSLVTNDLKSFKVLKKYFIKKDLELSIQYYSNNNRKYVLKLFYNNKEFDCNLFFNHCCPIKKKPN